MEWSNERTELIAALVKAQAALRPVRKGSVNDFKGYKYADLADIWDACRSPLTDNGLCVLQATRRTELGLELVTTLAHTSGQWAASTLPVPPESDPQRLGSALTYVRKYALIAIVGLAAEDDDGQAASSQGHGGQRQQTRQEPQGRQPPQGQAKQQGQRQAQGKPQGQQQRKPPPAKQSGESQGAVDATVIAAWTKRIQAPPDLGGLRQVWADFDREVPKDHPLRAALEPEWARARERIQRAESDARRTNPNYAGD